MLRFFFCEPFFGTLGPLVDFRRFAAELMMSAAVASGTLEGFLFLEVPFGLFRLSVVLEPLSVSATSATVLDGSGLATERVHVKSS